MIHKPTVILYKTSYCDFCKRTYEMVLKPYIMRNEIYFISVNVEQVPGTRYIKEEDMRAVRIQETPFLQRYIWIGNRIGEHLVPSVEIIPPRTSMGDRIDESKIIYPEGSEEEFFRMIRDELDSMVMRRAYVVR